MPSNAVSRPVKKVPKRRGGGGGDHHGGGGGHERWLITYADMITLLMVFFVVLYSMSQVDTNKYRALADTLRVNLLPASMSNSIVDLLELSSNTNQPSPATSLIAKEEEDLLNLEGIGHELATALEAMGLSDSVTVTLSDRGLVVSFADSVLFDRGSADLHEDSKAFFLRIASILQKLPNKLMVEGHTDNLPIRTANFPSNWELSAARAVAVARFLTENAGVDPRRVGTTGYGEWRPEYPNDSEESRAKNRRVDLILLHQAFSGADTVNQVITADLQ